MANPEHVVTSPIENRSAPQPFEAMVMTRLWNKTFPQLLPYAKTEIPSSTEPLLQRKHMEEVFGIAGFRELYTTITKGTYKRKEHGWDVAVTNGKINALYGTGVDGLEIVLKKTAEETGVLSEKITALYVPTYLGVTVASEELTILRYTDGSLQQMTLELAKGRFAVRAGYLDGDFTAAELSGGSQLRRSLGYAMGIREKTKDHFSLRLDILDPEINCISKLHTYASYTGHNMSFAAEDTPANTQISEEVQIVPQILQKVEPAVHGLFSVNQASNKQWPLARSTFKNIFMVDVLGREFNQEEGESLGTKNGWRRETKKTKGSQSRYENDDKLAVVLLPTSSTDEAVTITYVPPQAVNSEVVAVAHTSGSTKIEAQLHLTEPHYVFCSDMRRSDCETSLYIQSSDHPGKNQTFDASVKRTMKNLAA